MAYIHLGEKIAELLQQQHKTKKDLGNAIGMSASNAVYLTTRSTMDVQTLHKISIALKYDFFKHFPVAVEGSETREMVKHENVFDVRDKTIEELKQKNAELEKQMDPLKRDLQMQKQENVYLKKINELLEKK